MPKKTLQEERPRTGITEEERQQFGELAKRLCIAYVSCLGGTQYESTRKQFEGKPVGDYWYLLAMQVEEQQLMLRK